MRSKGKVEDGSSNAKGGSVHIWHDWRIDGEDVREGNILTQKIKCERQSRRWGRKEDRVERLTNKSIQA